MLREQHNVNSNAASVYGRYVLFYDYLIEKRALFKPEFHQVENFNMVQNNIVGTIEDLTEANLKKHGFESDEISDFFNPDIYQHKMIRTTNNGIVFASAKEGKIYSGFAGARKAYFETGIIQFPYKYPQLTLEFFELKLAEHLKHMEGKMGPIYSEDSEKRIFIDNQILWANNDIEQNQKAKENFRYNYQLDDALSYKTNIEILKSYLAFLNNLLVGQPQHNDVENTYKRPLITIKQPTIEEKYIIAKDYLNFFKGYNRNGTKIMEDVDFERLIEYTEYLIKNEAIAYPLKDIPHLNISNEFIRYTFYLIHKKIYGTNRIKPIFIDFLQTVFTQFKNTNSSTTKTKFSVKPPQYDTDSKLIER